MVKILGAVLAGGTGRRFGSDKAMAMLAGRPLIDHAIAALAPWVDAVVVCGRGHVGMTGLPDRPAPGLGPLGGINAALHHARGAGFDVVLTIACDMPVLPRDIATRLVGPGARVVAGQPMLGCWPATLADRLDAHLADTQDRSLRGWIAVAGAETIPADGRNLPNINSPDDLTAYIAADSRIRDAGAAGDT